MSHAHSGEASLPTGWRLNLSIVGTLIFTFFIYLTIGMLLATVAGFVRQDLKFSALLAGSAVSLQYLSTFISRAFAGGMSDRRGPKLTVMTGFGFGTLAGLMLAAGVWLHASPWLSLGVIAASRLALGVAESCVGTGASTWKLAQLPPAYIAKTLSWNGVMSYGGIAVGAPLGALLQLDFGLGSVGLLSAAICAGAFCLAGVRAAVAPMAATRTPFGTVVARVLPYGAALALASTGFGTLASFVTLYFVQVGWHGAALALSGFAGAFVLARFVFAGAINRFGGMATALASIGVEISGLALLLAAGSPWVAQIAAAITGAGFSLIFPALGVVAVNRVPTHSRGSALGTYNLFLDVALFMTGPLAGLLIDGYGYLAVFEAATLCVGAAGILTGVLFFRARAVKPA